MEPITPVLPEIGEGPQITVAENQKEYKPLPVLCTTAAVMSRWKLSDEDRRHIASGGDLFIVQMNFSEQLQPILPFCGTDDEALEVLASTVKNNRDL
jgi:hypothetical protein